MRCALPEERANLAAYAELTVRKPHLPGKDENIPNEPPINMSRPLLPPMG